MSDQFISDKPKSTNVRYNNFKQRILCNLLTVFWNIMPILAKKVVKNLFFAPRKYKIRPEEKQLLDESEPFEIVVNDKRIQCWKWGQGPGILLAHGWNGSGIQMHRFIHPLLDKGYAVIAFDAPGHGASDGKTSSYFEYSDAIRFLLSKRRDLNIRGAIAHSFGAAAILNGMHKERYPLAAVLISPALKLFRIFHQMFSAVGVPEHLLQSLVKDYENNFGYDFKSDEPFRLLSLIPSDTLIVHDREDETVPYADSVDADSRFEHVTLHTTRSLGHKQILYHPETIEYVTGYLSNAIDASVPSGVLHRLPKPPHAKTTQPGISNEAMGFSARSYELLEAYKASDFEKRLFLFLDCPELRNDFIETEKQNPLFGS